MKSTAFLLIAGIAGSAALATTPADAFPTVLGKPPAKKEAPKAEPGPTAVDKKLKVSPDGLRFGMTLQELSKLYEKVFDEEFVPLYQKVEPGPRMSELDSELADKKQLLMRNKLDFGPTPSGLDNGPLAGEFTYNNGESMSQIKLRNGTQRIFFFFSDHLWKVYEIQKLGKKSKLGADYDAALENLTKQLDKGPRVRKADPAAGRNLDQVDWQDKETILRLIDHGNGSVGLVYIDRSIEERLDKYRTNKAAKEEVDRDVSDVTRPGGKAEDKNKDVSKAYTKKK